MSRILRRRQVLRAGLAAGAAWCLPSARACEFFTTRLRVTHPWTRANATGATSAIVCMKFDEVSLADRLIGVETPVARAAEIGGLQPRDHVDVPIPVGQETLLSESGSFLRLTGLTQALEIGCVYDLTLLFEHGGRVAAELSVDYT